jgi:pimeloyl-ACP methyl ester carboxylesterase
MGPYFTTLPIACETPVKGIAVYGTQSRTWLEYLFDIVRSQGIAGGKSYEDADETVRQVVQMMALLILEGKSVDEVKKSHPQFAPLADAFFPRGRFNDKSLPFWRQLNQTNFATYWSKCNARVLAVHGASDHVTYDVDHQLIADMVNRANPGYEKFEVIPDSDHLFHGWKTQRDSIQNFGKGTYNPAFSKRMME